MVKFYVDFSVILKIDTGYLQKMKVAILMLYLTCSCENTVFRVDTGIFVYFV